MLKILESTKSAKSEKIWIGISDNSKNKVDGKDEVDSKDKVNRKNEISDNKVDDNKIAKKNFFKKHLSLKRR